jgi:hypothetical protein
MRAPVEGHRERTRPTSRWAAIGTELDMRQAFGPLVMRGSRWLERRGADSLGPRLKRLAYEPGREPVRIDDLVSPLRYDVLVRERFIAFIREHRALAAEDFPAFAELSRTQPYYRWFTGVEIPEVLPRFGGDAETVIASLERRLHKVIATYDDLERNGYDRRRAIVLRTGDEITPTTSGKRVSSGIHAGDGCHRLAWLRLSGVTELAPGTYRVHRMRRFTPRDITQKVLETMEVTRREYFSFLSLRYADVVLDNEEALLDYVRSADPGRVQELRDLIAIDAPLLARP